MAKSLVHIVDDLPDLGDARPALIYALEGFMDAGSATALAVQHLLGHDAGRVVASFDIDAMYDYRARRPALTFEEHAYLDYAAPRLVVRLCHDSLGTPYYLMNGPEPDFRWEGFAKGVAEVVKKLDIRVAVAMGAVPMAVPHTRPVLVTNHANRSGLLVMENVWKGQIRVPASAVSVVEHRLGEWGQDAMGFVVHVPHYLANVDFPAASVKLIESVELATGLEWELASLEVVAESASAEIAEQIRDNDEVAEVVAGLERQYDAFHTEAETLPLADPAELPSADELGAEFEAFLAGLETDE